VNMGGSLYGEGLTILGSGSTTVLTDAYLKQNGNVLISDKLVVDSSSVIEVTTAGGLLDVRGSILVKSGATLTLLASELRLGGFGGASGSLVLEAGATLVLGAQTLTVASELVIDGGGTGALVLRGAQIAGQVQDFDLSVQDLDQLAAQMQNGSFGSITVGLQGTQTTVRSPGLWSEQADSLVLSGRTVHLGAAAENAQWQIGSATRFVALDGDLNLNADLRSASGAHIMLQAGSGQIRMAAQADIVSQGALVTLKAAQGIEVGRIDTSGQGLEGAVGLDSAGGRIVLADTYGSGMGVRAQSVSVYGFGQDLSSTEGDRVLRVESEQLQVSAPSGVVSRGLNANGSFYRLMDAGKGYAQLQLQGQAPQRVMLATQDVAGEPAQAAGYLAVAAAPTAGFTQQVQSLAWPAEMQAPTRLSAQTMAYLSGSVQPLFSNTTLSSRLQQGWIVLDEWMDQDADLLSDLAYGFDASPAPSFVMGLPGLQPASSGLLPSNEVLFDYLVDQ